MEEEIKISAYDVWNNLQGGIPDYTLETNPDADVFEPIEIDQDV